VLLFFALGLMCKPMLVTLPLVLLLLDYWPLGRISEFGVRSSELENAPRSSTLNLQLLGATTCLGEAMRRRKQSEGGSTWLFEKLPLFGLAVASCVVTIFVQQEALQSFDKFPLSLRAGNALISYMAYLGQMFRPSGLAVLYPLSAGEVSVSKVVLSLVLLAGITAGALIQRRRCPYLLTGWLWYLIMLVPVIGIVQAGDQAHADRYTYLPQIGLYLLLTWLAADLCAGWRHRRWMLGGLSTVILAALIFCARAQTAYWRNSESLWTHALDCTSGNYVAHNNLGNILCQKGQMDEAINHFLQALEIKPAFAGAHNNLGNVLVQKGRLEEAIAQYQKALEIKPDYVDADINIGITLLRKGRVDEAITYYQDALQIKPDSANACYNLGNALLQKGDLDEAIARYQTALQISPDNAKAHNNLGNALLQKGRVDEATAHFQKALQINPASAGACYNLGNALLQKGDLDEAIAQYQRALQIKPGFAEARNILRTALLQKGREDEIMAQYQKALQINPDHPGVLNNLAWLLATCPDARIRDGVQAVKYAERACELTHYGVPPFVGTLAAAYAEAGRFDEAIAAAEKTCALAAAAGETNLLDRNQKLLDLYRAHQPYHEVVVKLVPSAP
jgi:tetratricopeptide (TPR) repeat protein